MSTRATQCTALYILLAQDVARVELFTQAERSWLFQGLEDLKAELPLDVLGIVRLLAEPHDGVSLPATDAE